MHCSMKSNLETEEEEVEMITEKNYLGILTVIPKCKMKEKSTLCAKHTIP